MRLKRLITLFPFVAPLLLTAQDTISLAEATALALENNFGIRIARLEGKIAGNNNSPGNAGFLPGAGADLTQTYNISTTRQQYSDGRERTGDNAKSNTLTGRVMLNWTLFDGFGMFIRREKLEELEKLGQVDLTIRVEQVVSEVHLQYYLIIQNRKTLQVIREAIGLSNERLMLASKKMEIGSGSELSYLQSRVDMNSDSARLLKQETSYRNAKADFNTLLGRDPAIRFEVLPDLPIREDLDANTLRQRMNERNPELKAMLIQEQIALLERRESRAGMFPEIGLFGGYNYNKSEYDIGLMTFNRGYGPTYGLTASFRLFDGFAERLARQNTRIQADIAGIERQQAEIRLQAMLIKTFNTYQQALTQVRLELLNQEVARKNLFVATEHYQAGGISDIDLRATQQKLIEAEGRLIESQFLAKEAELGLLSLSGQILDMSE